MHSLLFDPALVGRLKQFLISIAIHLKSAKKRSCLIFTLITSFMLENSTPFYSDLMIYSLSLRRPTRYRKIPKISPGAYIIQRPFLRAYTRRSLSTEGNLRFKIDLASLIFGSKFTVFALFYFVFDGNFKVKAPPPLPPGGAYILRGDLTKGFLRCEFKRLIIGGAYFQNFTVCNMYLVYILFLSMQTHAPPCTIFHMLKELCHEIYQNLNSGNCHQIK